MMVLVAGGSGCGSVADESRLPPDVQDPKTLHTPDGALAMYQGALQQFATTFQDVVTVAGVLTDELAAAPLRLGLNGSFTILDSRQTQALWAEAAGPYTSLHRLRAQVREARGFLDAYASDSLVASFANLRGHLYAIEGYAEILLADLFCSGIPLSTVDFEGNYTLAVGSTSTEVYDHALALFDSALTLTKDSTGFQSFAALGRARVLVMLGRYADASMAATAVATGYTYQVTFIPTTQRESRLQGAVKTFLVGDPNAALGMPNIGSREGGNGLDYRNAGLAGDPRVAATVYGPNSRGDTLVLPAMYPAEGAFPLTVASGIEARLIEAEAALYGNPEDGRWLDHINQLRRSVGLSDTIDPGPGDFFRNSLLLRERAFWLYMTAHRQGDLRRLVRRYGRRADQVFPAGNYPGGTGTYGEEMVLPVPASERELNPRYTGCFSPSL